MRFQILSYIVTFVLINALVYHINFLNFSPSNIALILTNALGFVLSILLTNWLFANIKEIYNNKFKR